MPWTEDERKQLIESYRNQVSAKEADRQFHAATRLLEVCDNDSQTARAALELIIAIKESFYKELQNRGQVEKPPQTPT